METGYAALHLVAAAAAQNAEDYQEAIPNAVRAISFRETVPAPTQWTQPA